MKPVPDLVDTGVAQAAIKLSQSTESPSVFNHSVRSYLFAELRAKHDGMRAGVDYDSEALFLGCVLHDLGAGSAAPGKQRFEVEGADLAAALLTEHGCDRAVVDGVWEAIALHTSFGIVERRGPLCYLVNGGVGMDFGRDAEIVDEQTAAAVHARYPRLSMASSLTDAIVAHAQRSPTRHRPIRCPPTCCANGRPTASPPSSSWRHTAGGVPDESCPRPSVQRHTRGICLAGYAISYVAGAH